MARKTLAKGTRKKGRPTVYTEDLANLICERVALGDSIYKIGHNYSMPSEATIYNWLRQREGFSRAYSIAREARAEYRSHRIDVYVQKALRGEIRADVARVAIDAEKWQAARESPRKFGDKVTQEVTGPGGVHTNIQINFVNPDGKIIGQKDVDGNQLYSDIQGRTRIGSRDGPFYDDNEH